MERSTFIKEVKSLIEWMKLHVLVTPNLWYQRYYG